jgi:hypothetical protein
MEFRNGLTIKPTEILKNGQVIFTDGTNDVTPNQVDCEAYGYTYDVSTRTCVAYSYSTRIEPSVSNESNIVRGDGNSTEKGTNNSIIMGESNTTKGDNRNNIIIGDYNEIANGVNNATILGNYGEAQRDGEIVFGGGAFNGLGIGYGQSSTITLSGTTTDATQTNLKVNSSSTNTIIARGSTSSFQGFQANVMGVRTGGSAGAGAVNDRIYLQAEGLVYLKDLQGGTSRTIAAYGTTTGWTSVIAFSSTNDLHLSVTGVADMNISWSATLCLYEMKV